MPRPASLSLHVTPSSDATSVSMISPRQPGSALSSPSTPSIPHEPFSADRSHRSNRPHFGATTDDQGSAVTGDRSPEITSLPPFPASPVTATKPGRDHSRGFFSNLKATKSSNKTHNAEPTTTIRQVPESPAAVFSAPSNESIYTLRRPPGSTPDLSTITVNTKSTDELHGQYIGPYTTRDFPRAQSPANKPIQRKEVPRRPAASTGDSDSIISQSPTDSYHMKRPKPRFGHLINRTRSVRTEDAISVPRSKPNTPTTLGPSATHVQYDGMHEEDDSNAAPMTAPLQPERPLREMMAAGNRNRSADRAASDHGSEPPNIHRRLGPIPGAQSHSHSGLSSSTSTVFREGAGSHLFANIKHTSTKAADGLGRASKGILGKMNRKDSNTAERDAPYVPRVINLPLVEQTRRTRIAGRLEDSKDKTEFWMPALPWRCIDYLNYRGCEEEGLYRVPGSDKEIRHWQKRFDKEGDINLFREPDLYDINIIGSMFKAWLRELPTEILPKAIQIKIAQECPGAEEVPQLLKDELSNLPPWNYYLLFAITCHLSLLTAYSDKNRMTYSNLCICFQPALKIDAFCFQFLVQQWRDCWQGCYTEKDALQDEYRLLDGLASSSGESSTGSTAVAEERSITSSATNKSAMTAPLTITTKPNTSRTMAGNANKSGDQPPPTTPAFPPRQNGQRDASQRLPELTPVKPLSPLTTDF